MRLRKQIFLWLEPSQSNLKTARVIEYFIVLVIVLNIVAIQLETVSRLYVSYKHYFNVFEVFSVGIFTIEYVLRIWTCVEKSALRPGFGTRLRFVFSLSSLIDLISILPFYLSFLPFDLRWIRLFRLLRFFRMLKVIRYLTALNLLIAVIRSRKEQLLVVLVFIFFLLIIVSTLMYYVEGSAQPEVFSSIPASMWWGIATLTTVGYGDIVPITVLGKVLAGLISLIGVGMYALPAGILSAGISEHLRDRSADKAKRCQNCGKDLL